MSSNASSALQHYFLHVIKELEDAIIQVLQWHTVLVSVFYGFKVCSLVDCLREFFEYNAMTDSSLSPLHVPVQGYVV